MASHFFIFCIKTFFVALHYFYHFEHMEVDEVERLLILAKEYEALCIVDLDDVSNIYCVSEHSFGIYGLVNFALDKDNR